jgi:Glycosyl hydrolases family 35/Beta-galactosidase, galactose-binding domain
MVKANAPPAPHHMKHKPLTGLLVCVAPLLLAALIGNAAESARSFLQPDRICYDRDCLTIDGKDVFIYSGAFHYFRCPKPLWRDRFQKIKEAGFNAVETYVAWNWSEPQMPAGLNDFSKVNLTDLDDWLKMAEEFGFYIIVRPGPYICAEWDTGGFPQWLLTKKPDGWKGDWLRSDEPTYLAWCKHWYDAVCPVLAPHQVTRRPPGQPGIILFQIENEYDYSPRFPDEVKRNQLKALAAAARAHGIDVPLFTCWTRQVRGQSDPLLRQVFDSCNFYPRWGVDGILKDIEKLRREQPDAPLMTAELQGGWFSKIGGPLSEDQDGVTASQINNLTLFAIQSGETILNYYMLFGGTNPGDWGARDLTTSYDYNAPIREWGGAGDRYQRVWALGHMLREHGARLARAQAVQCDVIVPQKDVSVVVRRAQDGSRYVFVRTSQHTESREGTARVKETTGDSREIVFDYALEPFGAKVLYLPPGATNAEQGEWLPKPAPAVARPTDLPSSVTITSARRHGDPGPSHWTPLLPGQDIAQAGIYDNRFLFYDAKVNSATGTNLLVDYPAGDAVLAAANGKAGGRVGGTSSTSVFALPAGSDDVRLLYENHGHANGGSAMELPAGIFTARLVSSALVAGKPIDGWRMHEVDGTGGRPEVKTDFDDRDWTSVTVEKLEADNLPSGHMAVYRAGIELTPADLQGGILNLNFGRIDDRGWVYVNGNKVGDATDWSRAQSFDVTRQLHPGHNVVAVIVRNNDGAGGLGLPSLSREGDGATVQLQSFGSPAGVEAQWWEPDLDDTQWQNVSIAPEATTSRDDALLVWYRLKFELQPLKPGLWVPWRLRMNATGNGFLYLNGHPLGRYWEAGPQRDFFLPECWLNFGPGRTNVLALSLRPIDKGAAIQSAVVEPYAEFAEKR